MLLCYMVLFTCYWATWYCVTWYCATWYCLHGTITCTVLHGTVLHVAVLLYHVTCYYVTTWYYVTWYCVTWLSQLSLKPVVSPQTLPAYTPSHPTSFNLCPGGLMSLNLGNLSGFNNLKITQTCCYQCKLRRLSFTKREKLQYFKTVHLWPQPLTPCSHQMTTTRFTISPRLEEPHTAG